MSPGMLCGSDDPIFASWGPVCSEKIPPEENCHFIQIHFRLNKRNISNINIQMSPWDALRFQ